MSDRPQYRVYANEETVAVTDWLPVAAAAWNRATRDRWAGSEGGSVQLERDGRIVATARYGSRNGEVWPDGHEPDLNDLAAALLQLARASGVDMRQLADSMTEQGLPTNRGRLDSIRAKPGHDRSMTSSAELIVMCYAVIGAIKGRGDGA